jgi:hypothetical protein
MDLLVTVTGWYRTNRPMHCEHFWSIVHPHLSSDCYRFFQAAWLCVQFNLFAWHLRNLSHEFSFAFPVIDVASEPTDEVPRHYSKQYRLLLLSEDHVPCQCVNLSPRDLTLIDHCTSWADSHVSVYGNNNLSYSYDRTTRNRSVLVCLLVAMALHLTYIRF